MNPGPLAISVIPAVGSRRFELSADDEQRYWRALAGETCCYCDKPLGAPTWYIRWEYAIAHVHCHEESLDAWERVRSNPVLREEAAKRAQMTLDGFDGLDVWTRDRLLRDELEHRRTAEPPLIHRARSPHRLPDTRGS